MLPNKYKDRRNEGDTVLRQCQLVQLHLLHVVDAICKENNIQYFLCGGTLLGAMRHNGFIPWDDDLDIAVPLKDFKRFASVMEKALPEDVYLQTPQKDPGIGMPFYKLRDSYSFYCEQRDDLTTLDNNGIYIDVFPYEDMPRIGWLPTYLFMRALALFWRREVWFRTFARKGVLLGFLGMLCAMICVVCHRVVRILLACLKFSLPTEYFCDSGEVGMSHFYKKRDIFPLSQHVFEDGIFPVPANPDGYLKTIYGDWRTPLPPEKRPPAHARLICPYQSSTGEVWLGN